MNTVGAQGFPLICLITVSIQRPLDGLHNPAHGAFFPSMMLSSVSGPESGCRRRVLYSAFHCLKSPGLSLSFRATWIMEPPLSVRSIAAYAILKNRIAKKKITDIFKIPLQ